MHMRTCPFCAEEIKDAAVKCKHCGEWLHKPLPESTSQTQPQSLLDPCSRCGAKANTKLAVYQQNISFFIRREQRNYSGHFCFRCSTRLFVQCELLTLAGTWWGIFGMLVGPGMLVQNLTQYFRNSWLFYKERSDSKVPTRR